MHQTNTLAPPTTTRLTTNQIRGFWAAWGGWALDGMDSFIYALVLTPAITELLPRSGIIPTAGNVVFYGTVLLALFMVGWGLSMLWGPFADRYGRVRALMLTIVCYSLFTFLGGFVTNVWQLAACRMLAGVGIGGEWSMGGTFVAEEWPEDRRKVGAGYMHTGYYFGFFLAALANYFVGANFGWRWMFVACAGPSLLFLLSSLFIPESPRWLTKAGLTDRARRTLTRIGGEAYATTALAEIHASLRPGGRFLGIVPAMDAVHYHSLLLLDRARAAGLPPEAARRNAAAHAEHGYYDFAFGGFRYKGIEQHFWQPFEIGLRLRKAGFRRVRRAKVRLAWEQFACGAELRHLPPPWDWFFSARR
jgi:MFS family permease